MKRDIRFVGLDVHAETISVAVAEPGEQVRSIGTIPNRPEAIGKLMKKLGPAERLRVCWDKIDGIRPVLAAHGTRCSVRGHRSHLGARQAWRPGQDGST